MFQEPKVSELAYAYFRREVLSICDGRKAIDILRSIQCLSIQLAIIKKKKNITKNSLGYETKSLASSPERQETVVPKLLPLPFAFY